MPTRNRPRWTIGQLMLLIAFVAILAAMFTIPPESRGLLVGIVAVAMGILLPLHRIQMMVEAGLGVGCPSCGRRGMERRAMASFGDRYFLCPTCGARKKRGLLGIWSDASGADFDDLYAKKKVEDPWSAPPGLEDDDVAYSKTHLNLVRNKRRRRPDDPNGPGVA